jgi:hypothetical protein
MSALIAPSKEATTKMDFLQACAIQKASELAHQSPIKTIIALVFHMMRIELIPFLRDEGPIYLFQSGMSALIAPSKEATTKMDFLQACAIQKASELAHQSPIKTIIVLVFRLID